MSGRDPLPEPPLLVATAWPRPGVCLVRVAGELDMATVPALRDRLRELAGGHPACLVLDLTGLTLLAATGISLLLTAMRNEQGIRGELHVVVPPGGRAARALRLTGVDAALRIHHRLEEALAVSGPGA